MKKLASTWYNMTIVLTLISVVAGAALAYVNDLTAGPIRMIKEQELHLVSPVCEKPSDSKSVRAVISRTRQNSDARSLREAIRDLLCDGKRGSLHKDDGRNSYYFGSGSVRFRHFSACK